jgi:hypothetical protein
MATQLHDFTMKVNGTIDPTGVLATEKVVIPDACWLHEVAVHTETGIDATWRLSMEVNGSVLSPSVRTTHLTSELGSNEGTVFDMHNSAGGGGTFTPLADRPRLQVGNAVALISDGNPNAGANAWLTLTFRRSSL